MVEDDYVAPLDIKEESVEDMEGSDIEEDNE